MEVSVVAVLEGDLQIIGVGIGVEQNVRLTPGILKMAYDRAVVTEISQKEVVPIR